METKHPFLLFWVIFIFRRFPFFRSPVLPGFLFFGVIQNILTMTDTSCPFPDPQCFQFLIFSLAFPLLSILFCSMLEQQIPLNYFQRKLWEEPITRLRHLLQIMKEEKEKNLHSKVRQQVCVLFILGKTRHCKNPKIEKRHFTISKMNQT